MIDNSEKIRTFLEFNENDYYFVQLIKRRKDDSTMSVGDKTIKSYYIESLEQYDKLVPIIKAQCEFEIARAYFSLNRRNYEDNALKFINKSVVLVMNKQYKSLRNVFDSITGKYHSEIVAKWLVDVDIPTEIFTKKYFDKYCGSVRFELEKLQRETSNPPITVEFKTKNGIHIVTHPFNLQKFRKEFQDIDVHKDAVTLLFCPEEDESR